VKRQKLQKAPPTWEKIHQTSRRAMLRTEGRALLALRKGVAGAIRELVYELHRYTGPADFKKAQALSSIKRTSDEIKRSLADQVLVARHAARDASALRVLAEIDEVGKHLAKAGLPALAKVPVRTVATSTADKVFADVVAESFAASWAQAALANTLAWEKTPELSLSAAIGRTIPLTDGRLRRIATSEVRTAFNLEHAEEISALTEPGAPWGRFLFRRWDATLERTCPACKVHHGEIVPLGQPFSGGDEPAHMHPHCRCIDTIVFLQR
jgi:hypothetical protein